MLHKKVLTSKLWYSMFNMCKPLLILQSLYHTRLYFRLYSKQKHHNLRVISECKLANLSEKTFLPMPHNRRIFSPYIYWCVGNFRCNTQSWRIVSIRSTHRFLSLLTLTKKYVISQGTLMVLQTSWTLQGRLIRKKIIPSKCAIFFVFRIQGWQNFFSLQFDRVNFSFHSFKIQVSFCCNFHLSTYPVNDFLVKF